LRYGEDFVLLGKGEAVLQSMIDRLIDIGICYGMEMDVEKATIPTTDYDRSKKTEECGIFQTYWLLGAIFTREIEYRLSSDKQNLTTRKRRSLPAILTKNLRNKLLKWYIWGTAFCCVQTVHLGK